MTPDLPEEETHERAARGAGRADADHADEHGHDGRAAASLDPGDARDSGRAIGAEPAVGADRSERAKHAERAERAQRRLSTTAVPLTDDPSGPSLAMSGPDPAGRYAFWLGTSRVTGITSERAQTALLTLLSRL